MQESIDDSVTSGAFASTAPPILSQAQPRKTSIAAAQGGRPKKLSVDFSLGADLWDCSAPRIHQWDDIAARKGARSLLLDARIVIAPAGHTYHNIRVWSRSIRGRGQGRS